MERTPRQTGPKKGEEGKQEGLLLSESGKTPECLRKEGITGHK